MAEKGLYSLMQAEKVKATQTMKIVSSQGRQIMNDW
jgi:hypothetical protein